MICCSQCNHVYSWVQMQRLLRLPLEVDMVPHNPNSGKGTPYICMYCGAVINVPVDATEVSLLRGLLDDAEHRERDSAWKRANGLGGQDDI